MEMETIGNFYIYTPSREAMPANLDQVIHETGRNNNLSPPINTPKNPSTSKQNFQLY
jgi:hypothetical protein